MTSASRSQRTKRTSATALTEAMQVQAVQYELAMERLAELELALEDLNWLKIGGTAEQEFSRDGLRKLTELGRIMGIKNPLTRRSIEVKQLYVWGQGVTVRAADTQINEVLQAFLTDPRNQAELSHMAWLEKEKELQTDGNLFLVFFINLKDGALTVRSIPFAEIAEKVCNPEDSREPWYYKRVWSQQVLDERTGTMSTEPMTAYYPAWDYRPKRRPKTIGGHPVHWDSPICHIKGQGGYSNWTWSPPEIYAGIDWARAYTRFMENWSTITEAYARFAWNLTTPGKASAVASAKTRLQTTLGNAGAGAETNPAPVAGATFIGNGGTKLEPVKTAGATTSAEDGRRLLLMVAAAAGLPETFYGDVSVGTLATAESLDRPTELAMRNRQLFWQAVILSLCHYVLMWAIRAPGGPLQGKGTIERLPSGHERIKWNTGVDSRVDVDWPPIVVPSQGDRVNAINAAAPALPLPELIARMLLSALGEDDIDKTLEELKPAFAKLEQQREEERQARVAGMQQQGQKPGQKDKQEDDNGDL